MHAYNTYVHTYIHTTHTVIHKNTVFIFDLSKNRIVNIIIKINVFITYVSAIYIHMSASFIM